MHLLGLAKKSNKKWAEMAINALKDLFLEGHLIEKRNDGTPAVKLYVFSRNPVIIHKKDSVTD